MQKKTFLLGLVAVLTVGLIGSSALAGPRVAIVKAAPSQMDLVCNSWHNNLGDTFYQDPPAANASINNRNTSTWSKESEVAIEKMVREAVKLGGSWPVKQGDRVMLVVNHVVSTFPLRVMGRGNDENLQAAVTDARVARAVALIALESGAAEVIIANGPGTANGYGAFMEYGFDHMVEDLDSPKVRLMDLGDQPWKWYPAPKALALDKYAMATIIGEMDQVISIPCLKTHSLCGVTSSLKNLGFGMPTVKIYGSIKTGLPHKKPCEVTTDVNMITGNDYTVVDALWGLEEDGPINGPGVEMGLIIAGADPVACDAVSTVVMGFKVTNIGTTRMAEKYGLGTYRNIDVVGRSISEVQVAFTPPKRGSRWPDEYGQILGWDSRPDRILDDL